MSENTPVPSTNVSSHLILQLLELQGIRLSTEDRQNTIQHFNIIQGHASNILSFRLDDHIEPAPIFQPANGEKI